MSTGYVVLGRGKHQGENKPIKIKDKKTSSKEFLFFLRVKCKHGLHGLSLSRGLHTTLL